jgi:hypothetical protein
MKTLKFVFALVFLFAGLNSLSAQDNGPVMPADIQLSMADQLLHPRKVTLKDGSEGMVWEDLYRFLAKKERDNLKAYYDSTFQNTCHQLAEARKTQKNLKVQPYVMLIGDSMYYHKKIRNLQWHDLHYPAAQ